MDMPSDQSPFHFLETNISSCLVPIGALLSSIILVNSNVESSAVTEGKYSGLDVFTPSPRLIGLKLPLFAIALIANTQFSIILLILTRYVLLANGESLYFFAFLRHSL